MPTCLLHFLFNAHAVCTGLSSDGVGHNSALDGGVDDEILVYHTR